MLKAIEGVILTALLTICPISLRAQQRPRKPDTAARTVSGTVLDPSGALIVGAQIALVHEDGTAAAQTAADDKGSFRFENVASGKYRIVVRASGFLETNIDMNVGAASRS